MGSDRDRGAGSSRCRPGLADDSEAQAQALQGVRGQAHASATARAAASTAPRAARRAPRAVPGTVAAALPTALQAHARARREARAARRASARASARPPGASRAPTAPPTPRSAAAPRRSPPPRRCRRAPTAGRCPGRRARGRRRRARHRAERQRAQDRPRRRRSITDTRSHAHRRRDRRSSKSIELQVPCMDRCPDGGGIGRGPVTYTPARLASAVRRRSWCRPSASEFEGEIVAHFGDNARIASVDVTGTWSWSTETRRSRQPRGAPRGRRRRALRGLPPELDRRHDRQPRRRPDHGLDRHRRPHRDLGRTTSASSPSCSPTSSWRRRSTGSRSAPSRGACVRVVPNEPTVHVSPASTRAGRRPPRRLDAARRSPARSRPSTSRVTPQRADGNPDARFTYVAPACASGTDFVRLEHTSRRGVGERRDRQRRHRLVHLPRAGGEGSTRRSRASGRPDFAQLPAVGHARRTRCSLGPAAARPDH